MHTQHWVVRTTLLLSLLVGFGCQTAEKEVLLRTGYEALDRRDFDQAQANADQYLADHPTGSGAAEATYLRGRAIEQRTKHNDAEAIANLREARGVYEQALTLAPSQQLEAYIQTSLGNVCFWLDDYSTAEVQWSAAYERLDRDDLKSCVLYHIAICQQRLGKWASADATFAAVTRLFPSTDAAIRAASHQGARAFYVQVAAFQLQSTADGFIAKLRGQGFPALRVVKPEKRLQLAMVGPLRTWPEAQAMKQRLNMQQYRDAMIVP